MPPLLSVAIITKNEEHNLARTLASVQFAGEIVIIDSASTDRTVEIAHSFNAIVYDEPWQGFAAQKNMAIARCTGQWILSLDADEELSPKLQQQIRTLLPSNPPHDAYYLRRRNLFLGRWIKHGGYYPKYLLKLFRRDAVAVDPADRVDHHFRVTGPTAQLAGDLVEDNRNEARISEWIAKHNRYARLQALEEIERAGETGEGRWSGNPDERTARLKGVWRRLPPYLRPAAYFFYRYVVRLGFLDGKEGFVFHFLQAWWYRLLVDINVDELKRP